MIGPELVLVLFLPPLLFDGAYYTAFGQFRRHLVGILSLALGAVLFTTLVVGLVAHWLVPALPWAACFVLGAIVSPPDAVAARAVLQRLTLPRRLQALPEGEILLNDVTGLVLFRLAVAVTLSGAFDDGAADAGPFMADIRFHFGVMLNAKAAGRAELIRLHREEDRGRGAARSRAPHRFRGDKRHLSVRRLTPSARPAAPARRHSTVTLLARFLGWSTSVPFATATW